MFTAIPATARCRLIFERRRHLLLGISPFNSRFSDGYTARLIEWAKATADDFDVLLAGPEAAHLLEAVGTAPARARTKSRTAINRNRRSVEAALARCGRRGESKIHTFGDFPENAAYVGLRREVGRLFDEDPDFRGACRDMSRQAIAGRLQAVHGSAAPISEEQVCIAVQYVLAELPFFLAAPDILDLDESLMVYHHPWPLGDRIFGGEFPLKVGANHGYLTLIET